MKRRRIFFVVLGLTCAGMLVGFWILERRANAVPRPVFFDGAVEVVFDDVSLNDQPPLRSQLTISQEMETSREVQIELVVCGPTSHVGGMLLFFDDARLSDPQRFDFLDRRLKPVSMQGIDLPREADPSLASRVAVEAYPFRIDTVTPCPPDEPGEPSENRVRSGAPLILVGTVRSTTITRADAGLVPGLRRWIATPSVGYIPGIAGGLSGVFTFDGIQGSFSRALDREQQVRIGTARQFVTELVDPATIAGDRSAGISLNWRSRDTLTPAAQIVDAGELDRARSWVVIASIGLAVGASVLAAMIWEWMSERGQSQPRRERLTTSHAELRTDETSKSSVTKALAIAVLGLAVLDLLRGRRD